MKTYTINADNDITQYASAKEADAEAEVNTERFSTSVGLAELAAKWPIARLVGIWNGLPDVAPVKKFTDRKTAVGRIWKVVEHFSKVSSAPAPTLPEAAPARELNPPPSASAPQSVPIQAAPAPAPVDGSAPAPLEAAHAPANESAPLPLSAPAAAIDEKQTAPAPQAADELLPEQAEAATGELRMDPEPATPAVEPEAAAPVGTRDADVASTTTPATKRASRTKKTPTGAAEGKNTREGSKTETIVSLLKRPGGASIQVIMEATSWQAHSVRGFVSGTLTKKMGMTVVSAKGENGERTYSVSA